MPDDQYAEICEKRFDEIINKLDDLNDRLFMDNGDCLQSKVNSNRKWIKTVAGFLTVVGVGLFGVFCWVLKLFIGKQIL